MFVTKEGKLQSQNVFLHFHIYTHELFITLLVKEL
jgi:hypothetical protein